MPSIGSVTVHIMRGSPVPRGVKVEEIERTGVDGQAYFKRGARSAAVRIETNETFKSSSTSVDAKEKAYKDLEGTVVSVVDAHGVTWTNCMVYSVDVATTGITGVSGTVTDADKMITAIWMVIKLGATT
jgi:hypothetical protein